MKINLLINPKDTLFGKNPTEILQLVDIKLSKLRENNEKILEISIFPDSHNNILDGGLKNILFITEQASNVENEKWLCKLVNPSDKHTFRNKDVGKITDALLTEIENVENIDKFHIIPIIDSHYWSHAQGIGGLDGLKNMIICFTLK